MDIYELRIKKTNELLKIANSLEELQDWMYEQNSPIFDGYITEVNTKAFNQNYEILVKKVIDNE